MPRRLLIRIFIPTLLFIAAAVPQMASESLKLFMKDGSYQVVSSYEVHGDRVRYYSAERSEWEEVPASQVDFAATERGQEEAKSAAKKQVEEAKEIQQQRFEKPVNQGLEVAPGIRLPSEDGIYTVEGLRLVRMVQSEAEIVTDKKRMALALAVPGPLMKAHSLAVLDGVKAAVRLSNPQPVIYVQFADGLGAKIELLRVKTTKESRVVEQMEAARGGGKATEQRTTVPLERTQISPSLYKVKPLQTLEPGEYVLGEIIQEKLNLDVWDFGIDKWEVVK